MSSFVLGFSESTACHNFFLEPRLVGKAGRFGTEEKTKTVRRFFTPCKVFSLLVNEIKPPENQTDLPVGS
jgi:hypothetical protein